MRAGPPSSANMCLLPKFRGTEGSRREVRENDIFKSDLATEDRVSAVRETLENRELSGNLKRSGVRGKELAEKDEHFKKLVLC